MSLLDFCNSLLLGLPDSLVERLQRVQNCAARVVTQAKKQDHIKPILMALHWLPIKQRIEYKVLLLIFKGRHELAPPYLQELLKPYTTARPLRSQGQNLLEPVDSHLKTYGGRAFECSAPELWKGLPNELRHIHNLSQFKTALKTLKFKEAFNC